MRFVEFNGDRKLKKFSLLLSVLLLGSGAFAQAPQLQQGPEAQAPQGTPGSPGAQAPQGSSGLQPSTGQPGSQGTQGAPGQPRQAPRGWQPPRAMMDLPYVEGGTVHQKLDLYVPSNVVSPSLIIYIHGGGWLTGDKNDVPPFFLKLNYAVASINCRPTSVARHPAQLDDCFSALHWLQQNAKKYGYSTENIGVVGASSGGHLACLMGTMQYPGRESVKFVADVSGPIDLFSITAQANPALPGQTFFVSKGGQIAALIGGAPIKNRVAAQAASPVTYVSATSAPVLIVHGGSDEIVPYQQAVEYHTHLDDVGVKNDLVVFPTAAHSMSSELWKAAFMVYVRQYLPRPQRMSMAIPQPAQSAPPAPASDQGFRSRHQHREEIH